MRKAILCGLVGVILTYSLPLRAAGEVVSGIFGYSTLTLLGNSDTIVSVPFARMTATNGDVTVASFSGSQVTLSDASGWTSGQFVYASGVQSNTYYMRINTGALEGKYFDITNNTTTTLTVDLKGGSLTGLAPGDKVSVVPYWTFGTVFANGNGIHLTTDPDTHKTDVLIPNIGGTGINLSSAATYYYFTNSGAVAWRRVGSSSTNRNDDILAPNAYIIIRHKIVTNTTFTSYGDVVLTKVAISLLGNIANKQDNPVSMTRPINLTLNDSALISSGAFTPSTDPDDRADELFVFDNSTTNINKSTAGTYYYYSSAWRKTGSAATYGTSNIFQPGAGFLIRKASGSSAITIWTNPPTYTNN